MGTWQVSLVFLIYLFFASRFIIGNYSIGNLYFIFFSYHFKRLFAQILFLILNILLLVYYFWDVLFIKDNLIDILFYANNTLAAMFILPYMLMFIRLLVQLKEERPEIKYMHLKIIGSITLFTCVFIGLILIYPSFLHQK